MQEVLQVYGIQTAGGKAACPFHDDTHPSMVVYEDGYHCFACGAHGDVIDFARNYNGIETAEACKQINTLFSLDLPLDKRLTIRQHREISEQAKQREIAKKKQKNLEDDYIAALDRYARLDRAIRDYAPVDADGFAPDCWFDALRGIGLAEYELQQAEWRLINDG